MNRPEYRLSAALGSVVLIGLVDHATGTELSMSLFYAVPIFLITWSSGVWPGAATALASVAAWGAAQAAAGMVERGPGVFYWNLGTRLIFFFVVTNLALTKRKLVEEQKSATTDFLTGIANRRGFMEAAEKELERARRAPSALTIAYMDCDNFKAVNDSAGHSVGNALLRTVGKVLRANSRGADVPARLGGDEFALLLVGADMKEGEACLDRLQTQLRAAMKAHKWPVTFSLGATCALEVFQATSLDDLVKEADGLMYQAKRLGKNRVIHQQHRPSQPPPALAKV